MKKLFILTALIGLVALPLVRADEKTEDAAIHKRYDEFSAAWDKHDPKLMASIFVPDGDLINPFGKHPQGRDAIEKLFTEEQSGPMAGTTYTGTIENIRYLAGGKIAIVDVTGEITGMKTPDGSAAPPFKHRVTWISEKQDGKWMTVSARAFVTIPPPAPPAK